jgi:hypothetical protein
MNILQGTNQSTPIHTTPSVGRSNEKERNTTPFYTLSTFHHLWNSIYASRFDSYSHTRRVIVTENYLNRCVQLPHGTATELLVAFRLNFLGAENTNTTILFTDNEGEILEPLTRHSVPLSSKREEWISMNYPIPIDMILGLNIGLLLKGESIGKLELECLFVRISDIPHEIATCAWALVDSNGALAWYGDWRKKVGTPLFSRSSLLTKLPPLFPSASADPEATPFTLPVKFLPPISFLLSSTKHPQWNHPDTMLQIQSLEQLLDPPILTCEGGNRTQV